MAMSKGTAMVSVEASMRRLLIVLVVLATIAYLIDQFPACDLYSAFRIIQRLPNANIVVIRAVFFASPRYLVFM